jgi:hypothetical protein
VNGETTEYMKHDFQVTSLKGLFLNLHPSEIKTTTSRTRQHCLRFFFFFFFLEYSTSFFKSPQKLSGYFNLVALELTRTRLSLVFLKTKAQ